MKAQMFALGAAASISRVGCAATDYGVEPDDYFPQALTASAQLLDASGRAMVTATATQSGDSIRVRIEGVGLPCGAHGAHVHLTGQCIARGFASARGPWNPANPGPGNPHPALPHPCHTDHLPVGHTCPPAREPPTDDTPTPTTCTPTPPTHPAPHTN